MKRIKHSIIILVILTTNTICFAQKNKLFKEYENRYEHITIKTTDSTVSFSGNNHLYSKYSFQKMNDSLVLTPIDKNSWISTFEVCKKIIFKKKYLLLIYDNQVEFTSAQILAKKRLHVNLFNNRLIYLNIRSAENYENHRIKKEHRLEKKYCRKVENIFLKSCKCNLFNHRRFQDFL
ncbi:MAG: hypothetical protein V2A54_03405 [Bacteroidota bacterium]